MVTENFIEIQKENTAYVFTYFSENKNGPVVPSVATIEILTQDGTTLLSSTSMTIDSTTGECTYSWDATGQSVNKNYQVKFTIDNVAIVRFFDIYYYVFRNDVTEDDLFLENDLIKGDVWEEAGKSESGTITTIVDSNRQEVDDYWNGGIVEIYQNSEILERKVVDFVNSTNTITFTPSLNVPAGENEYIIRKSYFDKIAYAGNMVQLDFKNIEKRAYLVIDYYQLKYLIIYKFFENWFQNKRSKDGDDNDIQYKHYADKYSSLFESMNLNYDEDSDGIIDDDEENTTNQIKWNR